MSARTRRPVDNLSESGDHHLNVHSSAPSPGPTVGAFVCPEVDAMSARDAIWAIVVIFALVIAALILHHNGVF